ncbi:protein WHAT'S THIS FACTOR 9, mitochondrial-like [Wolffia australiana]
MATAAALRRSATRARPHQLEKRAGLVNARIKWVRDPPLDAAVRRDRHLRPAFELARAIAASAPLPGHLLPRRRRLGLPPLFLVRRYPSVFLSSRPSPSSSSSRPFRWFSLTPEASAIILAEAELLRASEADTVARLRKLLMLTAHGSLPLTALQQLRWDLGLPPDFPQSLLPRFPQFFSLHSSPAPPSLRLLLRDPLLAVTRRKADSRSDLGLGLGLGLGFPMRFTRGFGLKRKWMEWIEEWQGLEYASPYDQEAIRVVDPRTDAAEKRVVALFHEVLHLTVGKKTERGNLSNLRAAMRLPFKFSKVFGRHPGIFYLSKKLATQTVVLREAYDGAELRDRHPLAQLRARFAALMRPRQDGEDQEEDEDDEQEEEEEDGCVTGTPSKMTDDDYVIATDDG